jgi:hypothetical protein
MCACAASGDTGSVSKSQYASILVTKLCFVNEAESELSARVYNYLTILIDLPFTFTR